MTEFFQLLFQGIALGSTYALVALAFTIVFRATHVVNFAQGGLLLIGSYVISWLLVDKGFPFLVALALTVGGLALFGAAFQQVVLRRVAGQDALVLVMITIGLSVSITGAVSALFGVDPRILGDPWGSEAIHHWGITFNTVKIWAIASAGLALLAFFIFDRRSRMGLAMRAAATEPEAALSLGVPIAAVHATAWAFAGAIGAVGGLFLAGFPNSPNIALGDAALRAFPAVVLGGLGSPVGAVVGGLVIGVVELMTSGYAPDYLGQNVSHVAPYVVMAAILLVRPYGLFGHAPAERL